MKRFIFTIFLFLPIFMFGNELADLNAQKFGILTLIPPVVAITLAFITKDVIFSLFIGVFSGTFMMFITQDNIFSAFIKGFVNVCNRMVHSMADPWNAGIILQVLAIGGVVALITRMGGTKAVAEWLAKKAKNHKSSQISTWLMGLFVFFDDYANALIVGPVMRPVTDKFKVSREKLAFIIDATAAPISGIAIISTWIGYELSVIKSSYEIIGMTDVNAFAIFLETLPYRFYNIFMIIFVFATAITAREFGPMYKAELRARTTGITTSKNNMKMDDIEDKSILPKAGIKLKTSNAIIPILVLMFGAILGFYLNGLGALEGEILEQVKADPFSLFALRETFGNADASVVLFQAALFATVVAIFMGVYRKIFTISEAISVWVKGWKTMIITIVILLLAWSLSSIIKDLGTSRYLVGILSDSVPLWVLPTTIFILGSSISFSTGTSYGTMGILMPLAIPLAFAIGGYNGLTEHILHSYMIINIGSVLTGAIFGDHCSPISDTTILSSMGAGCNHIDHVATQMPYALLIGAISVLIGYLPVSFGLPVVFSLALGVIFIFIILKTIGKKVE
ncbi:Na+/H+ antiporter NhaC family protein [Campylobacter ureolyticus]|uniref:Sodium:proton antiporter n=1 Tax=Campylobacter ureolyticus TaxID=827 RepID=A0AAE7JQ92_9BACT|nr:Na+/H+ antiporter NhaC family protein [Campylobacter ureolyticus]MCR8685019.1 Na+/H+ antiporter NhaC family protein [Campylobacter ureolyticus]QKF84748.1 sodium:proton antiporter [Campylobacter ureolyticus]QQY35085.1 Na+/H+ antiporter NhaC family protein [Campylobacter ureolyticus]SUX21331.1 Na(+)/H(+) antiporter family protein [Campylobacter ureolyticus]